MNELADRPLRVKNEALYIHYWRVFRWFASLRIVPRWREEETRILLRAMRRFFYEGLTRPGKILLICSLLIFLFSYRVSSGFLLATAAIGTALLVWSVILGFVYRPRVTIERDSPETAIVGQVFTSQIGISNNCNRGLSNFSVREMVVPYGRWPREWYQPHQQALEPGHRCSVAVSFEPQKRGVMTLSGIVVHSYFPFFLTRFTRKCLFPTDVYVLPETLKTSIPSLRQIADSASKKLKFGSDNAKKGPSLEYSYSRGYEVGDSLRRLDHRASSRLGKPMSKVFEGAQEDRRDQVYLMVDLTLADFQRWQRRPEDDAPLDERLALAVEVGLSAQNEGFTLSALATGNSWHPLDNVQQFYQRIATCNPEREIEQVSTFLPSTAMNEDGLHILILGRWTPAKQALVERWHNAGILCLVFLMPESQGDMGSLPIGPQFLELQSSLGKEQE